MAVKVSNLKIDLQGGSDSTLYASWTFKSSSSGGSTSSSKPKVGDKVDDVYCDYEVIGVDNMRITRIKAKIKPFQNENDE